MAIVTIEIFPFNGFVFRKEPATLKKDHNLHLTSSFDDFKNAPDELKTHYAFIISMEQAQLDIIFEELYFCELHIHSADTEIFETLSALKLATQRHMQSIYVHSPLASSPVNAEAWFALLKSWEKRTGLYSAIRKKICLILRQWDRDDMTEFTPKELVDEYQRRYGDATASVILRAFALSHEQLPKLYDPQQAGPLNLKEILNKVIPSLPTKKIKAS